MPSPFTPTVTNTVKRPDQTPATDAVVSIELAGENGKRITGYVSASDYAIEGLFKPTVNSTTAVWSQALVPNSLIAPAGTVYKIIERVDGKGEPYYITVTDVAGPLFVEDILTDAPGALPSGALAAEIARAEQAESDLQGQVDVVVAARHVVDLVSRYGVVADSADPAVWSANAVALAVALAAEPAGSTLFLRSAGTYKFMAGVTNGNMFTVTKDVTLECESNSTEVFLLTDGDVVPTGSLTGFSVADTVDFTVKRGQWMCHGGDDDSVFDWNPDSYTVRFVIHRAGATSGTGAVRILDGAVIRGWTDVIKVDAVSSTVPSNVTVGIDRSTLVSKITVGVPVLLPSGLYRTSAIGNCIYHGGGEVRSRGATFDQIVDPAMSSSDYRLCHLWYLNVDVAVHEEGSKFLRSGGRSVSWNGGARIAPSIKRFEGSEFAGSNKNLDGAILCGPYGKTQLDGVVFGGQYGKALYVAGDVEAHNCSIPDPSNDIQNYGVTYASRLRWYGGDIASRIRETGHPDNDWRFYGTSIRTASTANASPHSVSHGLLEYSDCLVDGGPSTLVTASTDGTFRHRRTRFLNKTNEIRTITVTADSGTWTATFAGPVSSLTDGATTLGSDTVTSATFARTMQGQPISGAGLPTDTTDPETGETVAAELFVGTVTTNVSPRQATLVDQFGNPALATATASGVTFTLSGTYTTAAISHPATAAQVQEKLRSLPSMGTGTNFVWVTGPDGGPYTVLFSGQMGQTDLSANTLTGNDVSLVGAGHGVSIVTTLAGGATVSAVCGRDSGVIEGEESTFSVPASALLYIAPGAGVTAASGTMRPKRAIAAAPAVAANTLTLDASADTWTGVAGTINTINIGTSTALNLMVGTEIKLVWGAAGGSLTAAGNIRPTNTTARAQYAVDRLVWDGTEWVTAATPTPAAASAETFSAPGALAVTAGSIRIPIVTSCTIMGVRAMVGTAPTGASIIVDVNKNGTTVFTTQANRPTIAIAATDSGAGTTPDVTALAAGDYLTVDIDQVGSTIAGQDLAVTIELTTP